MKGVDLAGLVAVSAGSFAVTTLPQPPFPGPVATAADTRKGNRLTVRTYDHVVVVQLKSI